MYKTTFLIFALLFGAVGSAMADGVTYNVTVNTSSIAGTAGSLDFQFNPGGLVTQAANLQILGLTTDGALGTGMATGDAAGTLPGTVTFDNGSGYDDYFTSFTFGNTISFLLNLFGPAVTSPDGTSTSGSSFAFSIFSDPAGSIPALTTDTTNGFALAANINLDGTISLNNYSSELTAAPVATPEPGTLLLLGSGLSALAFLRKRRHVHA
jgi:PEP-CTERM motif